MPETMEQANARRAEEQADAEALGRRLGLPAFRQQVAAADEDQRRWNVEFGSEVQRVFGVMTSAVRVLKARIDDLEAALERERSARAALETLPRQQINVSIPERETNVTVEVPTPSVTVEVPKRTTETDITERDDKGRIKRTRTTEVDGNG